MTLLFFTACAAFLAGVALHRRHPESPALNEIADLALAAARLPLPVAQATYQFARKRLAA